MSEIEIREVEFRLGEEPGTITGIAVPFNQPTDIGGAYREQFAPGAIRSTNDVKIFYGHDHNDLPIGKVIAGRETDAGYEITARLTAGVQQADETLALLRDGVLDKFSVGFEPVEQVRDGNTITRTKVNLREVSVVWAPAFAGASITEVREESPSEPQPINESESELENNIELDVRSVQDEVAELRRVVESSVAPVAPAAPEYMNYRDRKSVV